MPCTGKHGHSVSPLDRCVRCRSLRLLLQVKDVQALERQVAAKAAMLASGRQGVDIAILMDCTGSMVRRQFLPAAGADVQLHAKIEPRWRSATLACRRGTASLRSRPRPWRS